MVPPGETQGTTIHRISSRTTGTRGTVTRMHTGDRQTVRPIPAPRHFPANHSLTDGTPLQQPTVCANCRGRLGATYIENIDGLPVHPHGCPKKSRIRRQT